jgi:hypothetical protein
MCNLIDNGFKWLSPFGQPLQFGSSLPVPAGMILVSNNPSDFPPFNVPVPPPVDTTLVGIQFTDTLWAATPYATGLVANGGLTAGYVTQQDGHNYTLLIIPSMMAGMGQEILWQQTS